MTTLAAGASTTITLTPGQSLLVPPGGAGIAVLVGGPQNGTVYDLGRTRASIGAFDHAQSVSLSATAAIAYFVQPADVVTEPPGSPVSMLPDGSLVTGTGVVVALSEVSPYLTMTATGAFFVGAGELGGWICSVAAGTITVYDALSATGTPIVPATTLAVGSFPIFGAGTNGKLALTTGCWVVLSGAATVRLLGGAT